MMTRSCLQVAVLLAGMMVFQSSHSRETYVWSVVPQFTGIAVHRDWTPLLRYLESVLGYDFKLRIYDSIAQFEVGFLEGKPDFAYMNPYHAVMAHNAQGYVPLVRNAQRLLEGIVVVRKDSTVTDVKQLNGATISFPSPNAFAAALYMRALLRESEGIDFKPVYAGTHSNSYRQVLLGRVAASGAVKRTLRKEREETQEQLRIVYTTPAFPSHPLVVHPRVPEEVRQAVQQAILDLNKTEEGRAILEPILLFPASVAVYEADYAPLLKLNLDRYVVRYQ